MNHRSPEDESRPLDPKEALSGASDYELWESWNYKIDSEREMMSPGIEILPFNKRDPLRKDTARAITSEIVTRIKGFTQTRVENTIYDLHRKLEYSSLGVEGVRSVLDIAIALGERRATLRSSPPQTTPGEK